MTDDLKARTANDGDCRNCGGEEWVCENHRDRPWEGGDHTCCGGAGAPCPVCNSSMANAGILSRINELEAMVDVLKLEAGYSAETAASEIMHRKKISRRLTTARASLKEGE